MKKICLSVLVILFSMCMFVSMTAFADNDAQNDPDRGSWASAQDAWCYADDNRYIINDMQEQINSVDSDSKGRLNNLESAVNNIDLKKDMEDFFNEKNANKTNDGETHPANSFTDKILDAVEEMWSLIPDYLQQKNHILNNYILNVKSFKNSAAYGIFVNVGYSLVLVFFAASLIENTIKYEIFTLRGSVQILGRLLISKLFIDLSGTICIYILNVCTSITSEIFDSAGEMLEWNIPNIASVVKSNVWLVGGILDVITAIIIIIPVIIIAIAMIFAASIIMVRLVLRSLELSLLIIVSPAFFACYSSDVTRPYFKSFIMTFIQCAVQIVFMAVVYFVGTSFIVNADTMNTDSIAEVWLWFTNTAPMAIIALAIAIMMIKPPKVLTGLIK